MSKGCKVCEHAEVEGINLAVTRGETRLSIAQRYGLSESAVQRHKDNAHIPKKKRGATRLVTPPRDISDLTPVELDEMEAHCVAVIESETDDRTRMTALREWRSVRELRMRVQQLQDDTTHRLATDIPIVQTWLTELAMTLCEGCKAKVVALPPGGSEP